MADLPEIMVVEDDHDIKLGKDRIKGWDIARRARAINPGLPII